MKVLIIEDNSEIIESIFLVFQLYRPEAVLFSSDLGEKGVKMVETEVPDIVILDIGLPDVDGFEVLRRIRRFSNVPVIILTVKAAEMDRRNGLELGADDYISKPFSPRDLLNRVESCLHRPQRPPLEEADPG